MKGEERKSEIGDTPASAKLFHRQRGRQRRHLSSQGGGAEAWKDGVTTMQKTRVNVSGVKACLAESVC